MANIDPNDLKDISRSFKRPRPSSGGLSSLEKAQREVNFGTPKINQKQEVDTIDKRSETPLKEIKIKLNVSSPKIKKRPTPPQDKTKKLVQTEDIEKLVSEGEFSSKSISFIPYGAGLLNAREALDKIKNSYKTFKILEENYLTKDNLKFIFAKIDKIYDLNTRDKQTLKDFYNLIFTNKKKADESRDKAKKLLAKINSKAFREKLSAEVQRMMKPKGDLYVYYSNFDLIDEEFKKRFIARILSIDAYIIKKTKELVNFNNNDILFSYSEILEYISVINTRNYLMENFHQQVEHLANEKNEADNLKKEALKIEQEISDIAKTYGRSGKYGLSIVRSSGITQRLKESYFSLISEVMEPPMTKLQKIILSLETGNYLSLKSIQEKLDKIIPKDIENSCFKTYEKIEKQTIK